MAVVKVSKLNTETAPKSARVSISASAVPAAMAGRAMGSATRKKLPQALRPWTRAASMGAVPWLRKAARLSM